MSQPPLPDPAKLAWSPAEARIAIGVSARTLWQLTKDGRIPHLKLGRLTKYRPEAVAGYLASLERAGNSAE